MSALWLAGKGGGTQVVVTRRPQKGSASLVLSSSGERNDLTTADFKAVLSSVMEPPLHVLLCLCCGIGLACGHVGAPME